MKELPFGYTSGKPKAPKTSEEPEKTKKVKCILLIDEDENTNTILEMLITDIVCLLVYDPLYSE